MKIKLQGTTASAKEIQQRTYICILLSQNFSKTAKEILLTGNYYLVLLKKQR